MIEEHPLLLQFRRNGTVSLAEIDALEGMIDLKLPEDYVEFLRLSNGGEGPIGEHGYARFWRVEELVERNEAYEVSERVPGLFLFGSDGGNEAFAFDTRKSPMLFVEVPFILMIYEDIIHMSYDFEAFLKVLGSE